MSRERGSSGTSQVCSTGVLERLARVGAHWARGVGVDSAEGRSRRPASGMYCFHQRVSGRAVNCIVNVVPLCAYGKWVPKSLKHIGRWAIWGTIRCGCRTCTQASRWERQSRSASGTSLREVTSRERERGKQKKINPRSGPSR